MSRPVGLYRLFDESNALLYVGIAVDPSKRWRTHAQAKAWWVRVVRQTVEWYADRASAAEAEARAITAEAPEFNQVGRPGYLSPRRRPVTPDLNSPIVGAGEIRAMLNVSRQRVQQLVTRPGFPEPCEILEVGKIWRTAEVRKWARTQGREVNDG